MTSETAAPGRLDIGRVIQQIFGVLGRNFVPFFVLSLILSGLPSAVLNALQAGARADGLGFSLGALAAFLVSVVTSTVLQGALIFGTVQDLNGGKASAGDSLAAGLRAFLPLIGLAILAGIAISLGLVLFIVPGVMMACAWSVAAPSLVTERRGVFDSFSRSAELTRGNRWRILGLFLTYLVLFVIAGVVIGIVGFIAATVASGLTGGLNPTSFVMNLLISAVVAMVGSTGAAVLYAELRRIREGVSPEGLAEIFA